MAAYPFPTAYKVMDDYAKSVVKEMRTRLVNAGHSATGSLVESLGYKIEVENDELQLYFTGNDYGVYVDKGRKPGGKMPPIKAILAWTSVKGIDPEAAWPIAKAIARDGIKPTNYYTISTTRRLKQFEAKFFAAVEKDIQAMLDKM